MKNNLRSDLKTIMKLLIKESDLNTPMASPKERAKALNKAFTKKWTSDPTGKGPSDAEIEAHEKEMEAVLGGKPSSANSNSANTVGANGGANNLSNQNGMAKIMAAHDVAMNAITTNKLAAPGRMSDPTAPVIDLKNPNKCKNCGNKLKPGANFCHVCKTKVSEEQKAEIAKITGNAPVAAPVVPKTDPTKCEKCGNKLKLGANFCHVCRTKVSDKQKAEIAKTTGNTSAAAPAAANKPPTSQGSTQPNAAATAPEINFNDMASAAKKILTGYDISTSLKRRISQSKLNQYIKDEELTDAELDDTSGIKNFRAKAKTIKILEQYIKNKSFNKY